MGIDREGYQNRFVISKSGVQPPSPAPEIKDLGSAA